MKATTITKNSCVLVHFIKVCESTPITNNVYPLCQLENIHLVPKKNIVDIKICKIYYPVVNIRQMFYSPK